MQETVTLAHGAGGKQTSELIEKVFKAHFENPLFTPDDAAVLQIPAGKMAMSTDGFIVSPAFFPGGNIGKLSICGTVNDLACMGAQPMYMTCAFVIEEGFPMVKLEEIASAMEKTAAEVGVCIVAGDTKVAGKGQVDGVFITTTGVGRIMDNVQTSGSFAEECVRREVREEAGLELEDLRLRGILTFILPDWGNELTFLYTARVPDVPLPECSEGILEWIPEDRVMELPLWEGDRFFLPLLRQRRDLFSLKLVYAPGGDLLEVREDENILREKLHGGLDKTGQ